MSYRVEECWTCCTAEGVFAQKQPAWLCHLKPPLVIPCHSMSFSPILASVRQLETCGRTNRVEPSTTNISWFWAAFAAKTAPKCGGIAAVLARAPRRSPIFHWNVQLRSPLTSRLQELRRACSAGTEVGCERFARYVVSFLRICRRHAPCIRFSSDSGLWRMSSMLSLVLPITTRVFWSLAVNV